MELSLSGEWLRIAVVDGSAIRPVVGELDAGSPRGRGLWLVESIADRWGAEARADGKVIWFEIARPQAGSPGGV